MTFCDFTAFLSVLPQTTSRFWNVLNKEFYHIIAYFYPKVINFDVNSANVTLKSGEFFMLIVYRSHIKPYARFCVKLQDACIQGRKYMGAPGVFTPEMQKWATGKSKQSPWKMEILIDCNVKAILSYRFRQWDVKR